MFIYHAISQQLMINQIFYNPEQEINKTFSISETLKKKIYAI